MTKTNTQNIYDQLAKTYGYSLKTLHWGSKKRQEITFKAIINEVDLKNQTLLDVGCGFGDFYYFLKNRGILVKNYLGIDISEEIIKIGRNTYPEINKKLIVKDLLTEKFDKKFDFVVLSGLFGLKTVNNKQFLIDIITKCFSLAKKGLIFNSISNYVDYKEDHLYYVDPCWVFKFCKTLTKWVNIKYDYNPWEFLIACYKNKK